MLIASRQVCVLGTRTHKTSVQWSVLSVSRRCVFTVGFPCGQSGWCECILLRTIWRYSFTGRWRACQARSSLQNPCWGIQDCGWPGKKSPFLTSCTAQVPAQTRLSKIIVIQALMKSIIALVRYLMLFFIIGSVSHFLLYFFFLSHIIESNMSLVCECLQLWLHCWVSLKEKELYDLDAIKVGLYFPRSLGPGNIFSPASIWSWKINEENWVHLQLLYKVISSEGHTLYWP